MIRVWKYNPPATVFILAAILLAGCRENEQKESKNLNSDNLFFDYLVWAEEGREDITCRFQFKLDNADGDAVAVEPPGKVELDGRLLSPDSTRFMGFYYETSLPIDSFVGKHSIVFTGADGKKVTEAFEFSAFTLAEEIPEQVKRQPFSIRLINFPERETPLRLVLLDTSLQTADVNEVVGVVNGEIMIGPVMLDRLANGPINLEISKEEERPLRQRTPKGGRIAITYVLKRAFDLVE